MAQPRSMLASTSDRLRIQVARGRLALVVLTRELLYRWGFMDPPGEGPLRLWRLPPPARLVIALFVATMGLGYASAILQLHASHSGADGKPGLTRDDVIATFHGLPGRTRLAVQVQGAMREHLKTDVEADALVAWAAAGAPRDRWEEVRPVFAARCVTCHGPQGEKEDVPLVRYEDVEVHTRIEPLVSTRRLIALTHIHVLAMGAMFGLLGGVFSLTSFPMRLRILGVALPFVGMILDFSGWWLTRLDAHFCDMILIGGALTGASVAILVGGTLAEVSVLPWLAKRLS